MKTKTASELETKLGKRLKLGSDKARYRKWRTMGGVLLCLLGLSATVHYARADTIAATNNNAITTPDSGVASLYPSSVVVSNVGGKIIEVGVMLNNISHTFPDDYDILLVGPGGQRATLMSDCGGGNDLNNVAVGFLDEAGSPMPDIAQITLGTYRPSNYSTNSNPNDTFPPSPAQAYSTSLSVFNNTSPNGTWSLYVVDDAGDDMGSIAGGWTLFVSTTSFVYGEPITIPDSGVANPYPAQMLIADLFGTMKKVRVTLTGVTHTFPDDLDIMLVGPGGQNAIIMSDVGGDPNIMNVTLTLDDAAANNLPDATQIVSGTFKPTNFGAGDLFPAPAPAPTGFTVLSVFNDTNPNGTWRLYVVDDAAGDIGSLGTWSLDFDLEPTTLANISTRLRVETGDNILIGGFIVTGTQPKKVIVRALGPSLPVAGFLPDPTLELRDGQGALIRFNDDWQFGGQEAEIIATGIPPTHIRESAIVETLAANGSAYTAIVRGFQDATGIGIVEAYDLDRTVDSKLANISTRGLVQAGDNVMIAGTIVLGGVSQKVIVRALGPSVPVPGTLADPTLELRDGNGGLIAANDDWRDSQEADIITTIPPTNNLESAIVAILPGGGASCTAIVRGANGTTGVALVEVYALN